MINLFLVLALVFGQIESESIVKKLQKKFETINYLQADFNQSTGIENTLKGKFYFSKENNYRIELPNNLIISDGVSIWNIDNKRDKVIISNIDEDPLAFSFSEYIFNYPAKCEVTEENTSKGYLITLSGENSDLNFKTAKLWINESFLINKITVTDFSENIFTLNFLNIEIDKTFNESLFLFRDDGEKKIIDLR
jgi:outer membrane lipoprotein-sorting protein